MNELI